MKPSVTKLIDMLDKPALLKWANKLGLEGVKIDDYRSQKKQGGTDYHLAIENYIKFQMPSGDDSFDANMQKFFSDKVVIDSEKSFETDYFVGRYDVKLMYRDFTFICDFKSNQKGVYFENKLQLAAYAMAEKNCHVAIVHLPSFLLHPVTIDQDLYSEFLVTLSKLYNLKSKLDQ